MIEVVNFLRVRDNLQLIAVFM